MKWTKSCRLGIHQIDSQHRLLFAIANELMAFENPDEEEPEFRYLFDHLRKYVSEHFADEKAFMQACEYPDIDEHLKLHDAIINEINTTLTTSKGLRELKSRLDGLMHSWIKDHILVEDRKYADWYNTSGKADIQ